jgi:hypothetical protein
VAQLARRRAFWAHALCSCHIADPSAPRQRHRRPALHRIGGELQQLGVGVRLRSIRNPTLLIAAADDLLVPWQLSELIAEEIAHACLVKLDHGGHRFPQTGRSLQYIAARVLPHPFRERRDTGAAPPSFTLRNATARGTAESTITLRTQNVRCRGRLLSRNGFLHRPADSPRSICISSGA